MRLRAYAKINPYLDIAGKREDGYHELNIIFRPVTLFDELEMEYVPGTEGVNLSCDKPEFSGAGNIIHKAYRALKTVKPELGGFTVELTKVIPSGAGMGGGSADAAAFLFGANALGGLGLSLEELSEIGAKVGADVPALLRWHPSLGAGIGEKLERIQTKSKAFYIVVKPEAGFSTPEMYKKYDELHAEGRISKSPQIKRVLKAINDGDPEGEAEKYFNVFEKVVPEKKLIHVIKKALTGSGALGSVMTGSGSCVIGTYENGRKRSSALKRLQKDEKLAGCSFYTCENVGEEREINYVYMVKCADGSLYTGWTNNLEKRFEAHKSGNGAKYTRSHGAEELVYYELFDSKKQAMAREYEIKQLSHGQKLALVKLFK